MTRTKSFDLVRKTLELNGDSLYHAYIPLDKHVVKKNSRPILRNRKTQRPFLGKSPELLSAELFLTAAFRRMMLAHPNFKTLDQPLWAVFLFFFPSTDFFVKNGPRRGKISSRIPDLSNLIEHPQDALTKAGVIEDDRLVCSLDLSRRLPSDRCALEVYLFPYSLDLKPDPVLKPVE